MKLHIKELRCQLTYLVWPGPRVPQGEGPLQAISQSQPSGVTGEAVALFSSSFFISSGSGPAKVGESQGEVRKSHEERGRLAEGGCAELLSSHKSNLNSVLCSFPKAITTLGAVSFVPKFQC